MLKRFGHVLFLSLLAVAVAAGCAKRPASSQASAPAPSGVAGAGGSGAGGAAPDRGPEVVPASERGVSSQQPTGSAMRPATKQFAPLPDLPDIYFEFDRYAITPEAARSLERTAAWLKEHPSYLLLIEGHADERGTNEYNIALGERRAKASMGHLVAHGVAANRITIISYGEERAVCMEHTDACWAKNRRAHFLVSPR